MKTINLKEHNKKYMEISKKAAEGIYPSKKIAKIGSIAGLGIGGVLVIGGIYGLAQGAIFGIGTIIAGVVTGISNIINLKRIESK
ncbi:hypothetical protein E5347_12940 [Clostridium sartagoforme]|uniref:Uncharacterized protein n=1 Tax=Clostridium sartagoforme TaxID=84031 RepID=A0A4S2DIH1_9CLOT|nr:hypothetical protein [Clostridium sartagoforme]TGY41382.1 hypothetical protein E5347_12940 [Clostridium sartagoforme]